MIKLAKGRTIAFNNRFVRIVHVVRSSANLLAFGRNVSPWPDFPACGNLPTIRTKKCQLGLSVATLLVSPDLVRTIGPEVQSFVMIQRITGPIAGSGEKKGEA